MGVGRAIEAAPIGSVWWMRSVEAGGHERRDCRRDEFQFQAKSKGK